MYGTYFTGVHQRDLETVIPRNENALVMVVYGKYKGHVCYRLFFLTFRKSYKTMYPLLLHTSYITYTMRNIPRGARTITTPWL